MSDQSQGAGLANVRFRKLENGYTVKYHVERPDGTSGFGGEIFCENIMQVRACVDMLITKHMTDGA